MEIKYIFDNAKDLENKEVILNGWIRNHRPQKEFGFIDFSDGTCFKHLQIVYDNTLSNFLDVSKLLVGSSISVEGTLVKSSGNQEYEVKAKNIVILDSCPSDFPIQAKRHTKEFLRENAYLRARTNMFQAVFRVRSLAAQGIHKYFGDNGYIYFNAPIITASDCEGAGEMFQVTTLDLDKIAKSGKVDYDKDFFGKLTGLTVSGQLEAETYALAFSKVYTFGPTFRAENSNTKTHMAEFWMIEPEIAFCDLFGLMDIEEEMLKYVIKYVLDNAKDEIEFLDKFVENGLKAKLEKVVINIGVGDATSNSKLIDAAVKDLEMIAGQKPVITKAKKSIAGFKVREGQSIGCKVTLRGENMYNFIDKLISIALPRVRDFRGVSPKAFDGRGNYTLGIKEQLIFSEIDYDNIAKVRGMDIVFVTTAKTNEEAYDLLDKLGIPFRK